MTQGGEERFDLVDTSGIVIGSALRSEVHGNPALLHGVVHCMVTNRQGDVLLQKRHLNKDIQPGKWDTSVGGHIDQGESPERAVQREVREEIGLVATPDEIQFLYRYLWRSPVESELVHTYRVVSEGPFTPQASEVEALRFWSITEIQTSLGSGVFTPNFEVEIEKFRAATSSHEGGLPS